MLGEGKITKGRENLRLYRTLFPISEGFEETVDP